MLVICWRGLIGTSEALMVLSPLSTMISRKRLVALLGVKIVSSAGRLSVEAVPVAVMPLPSNTLNTPSEMVAVCSSVHKRVPPVEAS